MNGSSMKTKPARGRQRVNRTFIAYTLCRLDKKGTKPQTILLQNAFLHLFEARCAAFFFFFVLRNVDFSQAQKPTKY